MLGLELVLRPAAAALKLNSDEVPDFPENAVANNAGQFPLGIRHADGGLQGNRVFKLEAGAGEGNILKIGNTSPASPSFVFPLDINEIGAQHPGLYPPV